MTQTNTTQNKEELSKEQQMELFTKFETILRNYKDENAINAYQANFRLMDIFSKSLSQAHQSGIEEGARAERVKIAKLLGDEYENMENNASFYLKLAESLKENKQ